MLFWLSCIKSKHIYIYFKSERIEIEIDNNNSSFEESFDMAEPQEIIREEAVEVVENPNTEIPSSSSSIIIVIKGIREPEKQN